MSEQERSTYAARVAPARIALGLTQDQLAERADVSRGTIGNIESGKRVPQADVLWRIMTALDLRPDMAPEWPEEIEGWLRVLAPVIQAIPDASRERVMLQVLTTLAAATKG